MRNNNFVINQDSMLFPIDSVLSTKMNKKNECCFTPHSFHSLEPILKWPGGKEKELKFILPNRPNNFRRYFEPFVGGGSVFMAVFAEHYYINDKSTELYTLYRNIYNRNQSFYKYCESIDLSWINAKNFFFDHPVLISIYRKFRNNDIELSQLSILIDRFCTENENSINSIVSPLFNTNRKVLIDEFRVNLIRKMRRMKELEMQKHILPENELLDNIETAIKSALYMYYRHLYNDIALKNKEIDLCSALFLFIRNYAYSAMFRYNDKGEFNVPYGGIAYNNKLMKKKLDYYRSPELLRHFDKATFSGLDFEAFFSITNPQRDDFVFLDPPYDTDFSTYAQNTFTKSDQKRLASWLLNKCQAKWMLVIKNTEFIRGLYADKASVNINTFDKKYAVSFMNRNNRQTEHLLITNY